MHIEAHFQVFSVQTHSLFRQTEVTLHWVPLAAVSGKQPESLGQDLTMSENYFQLFNNPLGVTALLHNENFPFSFFFF